MAQANTKRNIAVLIDGDNAQYSVITEILTEVQQYGRITICRAYGDWNQPQLSAWQQIMLNNAIKQIQVPLFPTGKNTTDIHLVIDAMDILYSGNVDGVCIVASDSDYTALCRRIREDGLFVMGIGHQQTRNELINECDVFTYVEDLLKPPEKLNIKPLIPAKKQLQNPSQTVSNEKLFNRLRHIYNATKEDDGWVGLGVFGKKMYETYPQFDTKKHGHKTLSALMKSMPKVVEIKTIKKSGMYIRFRK